MLAKIWKKLLLAICIIACLYNIIHKLVDRTSLDVQLRSVQNQGSLIDIFKNNKENVTIQEDNLIKEETQNKNDSKTVEEKNQNITTSEQTEENISKNENTIVVIY